MEANQRENSVDMDDESQVLAQAESLADREQWREAASLLKRLGQVKSLSVNALGKLASYCSQSGDYDSAISFYKSLSEQQPSIAKWFDYLGFQYQQKEKWDDAIASYEKGLKAAKVWLLNR